MSQQKIGKVYLVGGGPGDPGLLTVRAQSLMSQVDVVAYDALISPALLAMIPEEVEMVAIGYRGYHSKIGYGMHPEVIEMALEGKDVLRLKAGDPFIFGRGTQECDDLIEHNIPFEVVPGISTALGASAYAGFPLTSIGVATDVTLASGHHCGQGGASWEAMGKGRGTLALYMASKKIRENFDTLIREGRRADTPAIYISAATTSRQYELEGTLTTLPEMVEQLNIDAPALIIVGDVIRLRDRLHWRKQLPLMNKRILLSLQGEEGKRIRQQLENLGGVVIHLPAPRFTNSISSQDLQRVMNASRLVFTGKESVVSWKEALLAHRVDTRSLQQSITATSDSALQALNDMGIFAVEQLTFGDVEGLGAGTITLAGAAEAEQLGEGVDVVRCFIQVPTRLRFNLPDCDIAILDSEESFWALGDNNPNCLLDAAVYTSVESLYQHLQRANIASAKLVTDADTMIESVLNGLTD
ncbi:uroporphyrinogen-III C-methyltransferase [Parendozoicomonas haliclonae]|uniref:uroporphyrinogen-III C-methyltransferase n=1 Tax=Parendozoicomonas haliclonae TaxID=1960125 RepID=A0A1X7ALE9_9GAMM|nr:uroporphyrinogen-III C-methyltransferase [Parendozoicomonas haliclonae]SMA48819.1 Uroporphyrinogen-III C-methyltransferase [Parendozoicomonas haliclonae]